MGRQITKVAHRLSPRVRRAEPLLQKGLGLRSELTGSNPLRPELPIGLLHGPAHARAASTPGGVPITEARPAGLASRALSVPWLALLSSVSWCQLRRNAGAGRGIPWLR